MNMKNCRTINQDLLTNPIDRNLNKFIDSNTKVFTIGSCFALEIKDFLMKNSYNVLVSEENSKTPEPKLIWYNTYNTLYEFERITGEFVQDEDDVWNLGNRWQDPYRRCVFADTKEELWNKIEKLNRDISYGILNAECLIITLGLTETFFQKNGKAICASPGYASGGGQDCEFVATKFTDNYNNVRKIIEIIKKVNPNHFDSNLFVDDKDYLGVSNSFISTSVSHTSFNNLFAAIAIVFTFLASKLAIFLLYPFVLS